MKVCLVTSGSFDWVWQERLKEISANDLVVFGFNGLGLVSYKKELAGETEYFQDVAKLSSQLGTVVISGCDTDTFGVFRHSAVIADKGKILGVSDMVHSVDQSEYAPGGNFRVSRYTEIQLEALDEKFNPIRLIADGLFARIIQHEYDHLNGILICDK